MKQLPVQLTQRFTSKGADFWNKQQWHEFIEHAKAVAPRLVGKADAKNPLLSTSGDIGFLTVSAIYLYNLN